MITRSFLCTSFALFFASIVSGQVLSLTGPGDHTMTYAPIPLSIAQQMALDSSLFQLGAQYRSPLDSQGGSLSQLDLKAPGKARKEYDKGYQLLMKKDLQGAVEHLSAAIAIYPSYVSAHNSLGSAYLGLKQNDQARAEFAKAVALDDHLPTSFLNLGCAQLALKDYNGAEKSIEKASTIAPLDLQLQTALTYGQLMNHDYEGVVATTHKVHGSPHDGAAMVHLFAAASWQAQDNLGRAQKELLTFLHEDPKSPAAAQAVQMIDYIKEEVKHPAAASAHSVDAGLKVTITDVPSEQRTGPTPLPERIRLLLQEAKENGQIDEAESAADCPSCETSEPSALAAADVPTSPDSLHKSMLAKYPGAVLHASSDEVAVFFAATDHGKSVTNLTGKDVGIRDNRKPPSAITGFRNEAELPLRLGLLLDTSSSIKGRFKFEQEAAASFMQKVVTGRDDQAFVIGFANSVLLVQDFTGDQMLISSAVNQLVPSGGTALWDAVSYAAQKLANHPETQPVARVLVVFSDGEDNSSQTTLKQAIAKAQHGEVAIYAISTREAIDDPLLLGSQVGEHALNAVADLTGGASFSPGSVRRLKGSLVDLQQVIRSRYLISYKPALFKRDGQYRAIDIEVEKDGHKLKVYARKGYFASAAAATAER